MPVNDNNLMWVDLEMTGLEPDTDTVIEIATICTDYDLNILAEGPVLAIQTHHTYLDKMDDWNVKHHNESGLVARIKESKISMRDAEQQTLAFMAEWVSPATSPMCGNSICQDRRFMVRTMPELEAFYHYRNIDVSTIKELVRRWSPDIAGGFKKKNTHLALDDIRESIAELQHYRKTVFSI